MTKEIDVRLKIREEKRGEKEERGMKSAQNVLIQAFYYATRWIFVLNPFLALQGRLTRLGHECTKRG